jgi:BirA family transcriptional regulator, biotin operon repressor / biotin---[acetyl-CoA-carboxylase] ligase
MTTVEDLSRYLDPLGLGAWCYFPVVDSTNDLALAWAGEDAPDWALVVADAQTAGRGRGERRWVTEPGCALALSLVLRPSPVEAQFAPRLTALAALGLIQALSEWGLAAQLKWPNDILLGGKKVAGVLVELEWASDQVKSAVIGMGVNVSPGAIPEGTALRYPATAVESELGATVDRWALLAATLAAIRDYRNILTSKAFVEAWNGQLALRGTWVRVRIADKEPQQMKVLGVEADGQLALEQADGQVISTATGEILMPGDRG